LDAQRKRDGHPKRRHVAGKKTPTAESRNGTARSDEQNCSGDHHNGKYPESKLRGQ